jgi:RHS repeat-associated protein
MKTTSIVVGMFLSSLTNLLGQSPANVTTSVTQATQISILPSPTAYSIVANDANSRVWQRAVYSQSPKGGTITNLQSYTELASGLNHLVNGQWVESSEQIDILPNGTAAATNGQHQAYFPGDIFEGQIQVVTPDGLQLYSQPLALTYSDGINTVVIASLTNSTGVVVGVNQVVYANAFSGISADVRYTYTKAGFEQDVILHQQPPTPESYGLNADTARLQMMTEFFNPPQPSIKTCTLQPQAGLSLPDQKLGFGKMQMVPGRAFLLGQKATKPRIQVSKSWVQVQGRNILVEQVPVNAVADGLAALPLIANNSVFHQKGLMASRELKLPPQRLPKSNLSKHITLARNSTPDKGFVLDYQTVGYMVTNFTFQGDTTYYISTAAYLYDKTTIEGGTVVKFGTYGTITFDGSGTLNCETAPYRPGIFTSFNNNAVGGTIPGSNGNPSGSTDGGEINIEIPTATVHDVYFSFMGTGLNIDGAGTSLDYWNCQFFQVDQINTISLQHLGLHNVLVTQWPGSDGAICVGGGNLVCENVTVNNSSPFIYGSGTTIGLTNCIVTSSTLINDWGGNTLQTNSVVVLSSPSTPVYQTTGGGSYYLTNGSSYRSYGTTNINPTLLAELRQKTTYPPAHIYTNISVTNVVWTQAVQRDTNSNPDLGYHYDPIDYAVSGVTVKGTCILTNGVAVGVFDSAGYGLYMMDSGATLIINGSAQQHNQICTYQSVQESFTKWGSTSLTSMSLIGISGNFTTNTLKARFTDFNGLNGYASTGASPNGTIVFADVALLDMRDCRVGPGMFYWYVLNTASYTNQCVNNLFERATFTYDEFDGSSPTIFFNNTVRNGGVQFPNYANDYPWVVRDNLFDNDAFGSGVTSDHNAYLGTNVISGSGGNDVSLTNFSYASGPLGPRYVGVALPTLFNAGSRDATNAGLYHYTISTNLVNNLEIKETNSWVDIGFHYVATDNNGNPFDTDGDSIPDYMEDANGNGIYDAGDLSNWQDYYNGSLPKVSIVSGNNQIGLINAFFSQPLTVLVTNTSGIALTNAPITFSVGSGINQLATSTNGSLSSSLTLRTDNNGYSFVWLYLPTNAPATNIVTVTATSAANSVSTNFVCKTLSFAMGVNMNGPATLVEGNSWLSYTQALAGGLVVSSNVSLGTIVLTNLNPSTDLNTSNMLQTFIRRYRVPPLSQQTNLLAEYVGLNTVSDAPTLFSNVPSSFIITNGNSTNELSCYRGWCAGHDQGQPPWDQFNSCQLFYSYGYLGPLNGQANLISALKQQTNLNMVNYILNYTNNFPAETNKQNAIWTIMGQLGGGHYGFTPTYTNLINAAYSNGPSFIPTNNQSAVVIVDFTGIWLSNMNAQPLFVQVTNQAVGFTIQTNLGNGDYFVYLWLAEDESSYQRNLNLLIQGAPVATGIGTNLTLGQWEKLGGYEAVVTNGTLTVEVDSPVQGDPLLMGMAIYQCTNSGTSGNSGQAVSFISPTDNQLFVFSPTNIYLTVQPQNFTGATATNVYFSNVTQSQSLGSGTLLTNGTYQLLWQVVTNGNYTVGVLVQDNSGRTASNSVSFTVNAMPVVNILTPTNLQSYLEVTNVTVSASASDSDGSISQVQFYYTNHLLGTITTTGVNGFYNLTWSNRFPAYYPITAVATDNRGASGVSTIRVFKVIPTNPPPIVAITYPTNNSVFAPGSDITIRATATNWPALVTNVEFFVNGESIGSDPDAPYSVTRCCWTPGSYTLMAKATDSFGATSVSISANLTIAENTPTFGSGYWDQEFRQRVKVNAEEYDRVRGLAVGPDGSIYFGAISGGPILMMDTNLDQYFIDDGGYFDTIASDGQYVYASSGDAGKIIKISGTNWVEVGDELTYDDVCVNAFAFKGGDVYVGGDFYKTNKNYYVAKLDVTSNVWVQVGQDLNGPINAMAVLNGKLIVGGAFTNAGGNQNINYIAQLDGTNWASLGVGISGVPTNSMWYRYMPVNALVVCGTNLYVGGTFSIAGGHTNANGLAIWNGVTWATIGNGVGISQDAYRNAYYYPNASLYPVVTSLAVRGNRVFVGGDFTNVLEGANSILAANIAAATWSENDQAWTWSDLDQGVGGDEVISIAIREGTQPNQYDVAVSGELPYDPNYLQSSHFALWRVGYPQPASVPKVVITSPSSPAIYTNPTSIFLTGLAVSGYTNINSAGFYTNGVEVGYQLNGSSDDTNIFAFSNKWDNPMPGIYLINAVATDDQSLIGESQPLIIIIKGTSSSVVANNDQFTIPANISQAVFRVLTNDSPATGLKISKITPFYHNLGRASISQDGTFITYAPLPNVFGQDIFYYTITNASGISDSAAVTVNIKAAPMVGVYPPYDGQQFGASSSVNVTASASAYGGSVTNIILYLNGNSYGQTNTNALTFAWSTNAPAFYTFTAVATDSSGLTNVSSPVTIIVTNSLTATTIVTAKIDNLPTNSPGLGVINYTVVTNGIFDLKGEARDSHVGDPIAYQVMLFSADGNDTPIANVTPAPLDAAGFHQGGDNSGDLSNLNLTGIPNGTYELQLTVHGGGGQASTSAIFSLESQLKIGQFSFSEQDLSLPVSGIPITVTRTYNSLNPLSSDFGYSWGYAINSMDVSIDEDRTDITMGSDQAPFGDDEDSGSGLPLTVSVRTGGSRDVTLTLPDGRRTTFAFAPSTGSLQATAAWKAAPGVTATLTPIGSSTIQFFPTIYWQDGGEGSTFNNYDVPGWILQTQDGTQYKITRGIGNYVVYQDPNNPGQFIKAKAYGPPTLTSIVQRSGDTIVINPNSIYHQSSNGVINRTVFFSRDSQNRITAIYDPNTSTNGPATVQYVYGQDTGNLIQVIKLVNLATGSFITNQYHYDNANFPHYITLIQNADGVPVAQNFYDNNGKLTAVQDASGNLTQFIHNETNFMDIVIDRLQHTNTYIYDPNGNVTNTINALGQITTMAYDGNNNKTKQISYLNGSPYATNSYIYDLNLNLPLLTTDPLGHTNAFSYDGFGDVLTSTDARGNTTTNTYDSNTGNLIAARDSMGNTNIYSYVNGLLASSSDPNGTTTANSYDISENLAGTITLDAANAILSTNSFTYDGNGNRLTSSVWRRTNNVWTAAVTKYVYDAQNRVIQTINPNGGTNAVFYNLIGKQQATIDPLGRTNSYNYDALGRLIQTTYPDLTTETNGYDAAGNLTASADRLNRVTTYVYDALNRLTQTIYPDTTTNTTVYNGVGRVAWTMDARGVTNLFGYDAAGRRLTVTNALATTAQTVSSYGYDANGNQTTFTDANSHTTTTVFDALNRQVQIQFQNGTTTSTGYDGDGRRIASVDQANITNLFGYDGAGRLTSVTNAFGTTSQTITRYQYDEAGNQTTQIDALNRTNNYAYDGMGRRISHTMPTNSLVEYFNYDFAGNLTNHIDFNGVNITNQYDSMNRLTSRKSINGYQVGYTYTQTGQRLTMSDPSGNYSYVYDLRDRVTTNTTPAGILYYGYDANGNVTNITSSTTSGTSVIYQYDAMNRLTNVLNKRLTGTQNMTYYFDNAGNLNGSSYPNGVTNLYQYDSLNRLTNVLWKTNGISIASFGYTLGASGNRTALSETMPSVTRSYTWQYDNLYRLTNETVSGTAPTGTLGYGYDLVGNRTNRNGSLGTLSTQILAYNTNDWLIGDSYDNNGNTTNSLTKPYQYDVENRLTNYNIGQVVIVYDGDGNRVKKVVGSSTTLYLVDTHNPSGYAQVLEEKASNSTNFYTYGLNLISQLVPSSSTNYFVYDGHGSTRLLTDTGKNVVNAFSYDAYGTLIASNGSPQTAYLYCGQQFDSDLGLYYNRARYLNPNTGRFWTMDSYTGNSEDPLSLHKYLYGADNPVTMVDPSGHEELVDVLASSFIQSSLSSMAMSVISPAVSTVGGSAVAAFIPPQVEQKISASPEPDAVLFGFSVSGNVPAGKFPIGFQGGGGGEVLVSPKTHDAALYGYLGGGLTFGANEKSAAVQGVFGFVFDTPNSQSYSKHFVTLSLPYSKLPVSMRNKITKFLASGFGTALTGTSQEVIDNAKSIGCDFATALNLGTVNIFFDPTGGGSCGVSFSTVRAGTPNAAPSNIGATYSYYWQLLPTDDKSVPFR